MNQYIYIDKTLTLHENEVLEIFFKFLFHNFFRVIQFFNDLPCKQIHKLLICFFDVLSQLWIWRSQIGVNTVNNNPFVDDLGGDHTICCQKSPFVLREEHRVKESVNCSSDFVFQFYFFAVWDFFLDWGNLFWRCGFFFVRELKV